MFNKVFCIGFNKTGTSSMHRLFLDLGLRSFHGYYSHIPVSDPLYAGYQCFSDGNEHDFALLDRTFPGSRFILTTRRLDDWLASRIRHVEHRRSIGATGPMREEYDAGPRQALQAWVGRRHHYHERVRQYFGGREADLLVIDICGGEEQDSLARILGFLGLPARPGLALPHENPREGRGAVASGPVRSREAVRADVDQALRDSGLPAAAGATVFP